jgi:hypothetical protein
MLLRQRVRGLSLPCNDDLLSLPVWIKFFEMDEEWCISKISNKLIRTNFMIPLSLRGFPYGKPWQSQKQDWLRQHSSQTQRVGERDCFVAMLLAMTSNLSVIASLLRSRRLAISYFNGMYHNPSPKIGDCHA